MKSVKEVVCCVVDYGTFIPLADKLSESFAKVYYYSPFEREFRNVNDCVKGDGLERPGHRIERLDEFMDPQIFDEIDLFVFPDIGWGGLQKFLKRSGKAVWGSMGADELEQYRTRFIKAVQEMGLPMVPSRKIIGLTALREHLKTVKDKWVKINRYRDNMETWHHLDYEHSKRDLDHYAVEFGGVQEHVVFVVQDDIPGALEIGYDGWCVDGQFPAMSYQGYEKKNELYLGAATRYADLPKEVRRVNEAMAPLLKQYGYRNFIATEIRVKDGTPYFIDPTLRMPGQTGEQLLETCANLADVIWHGANGELIAPKFIYDFAAEATLHYTGVEDEWKTLRIPKDIERWVKLVHYCMVDGVYQFPVARNDEVGVVLGSGKTIQAAIDACRSNFEKFKQEPVKAQLEKFADLLAEIQKAQREGVKFTSQRVPSPASAVVG